MIGLPLRPRAGARDPGLSRDTGWALGAEATKLLTAVGTFLIVTALLPPAEYGVYVGTLGLMWFALPFATFGAGYLLLKRLAGEDVPLDEALGRAVGVVVCGGLACAALFVLAQPVLLPQSPPLVLGLLAVAELVFGGLHEVAAFTCQATRRLRLSMALRLLQGGSRFVAAVGLVVLHPDAGLTAWAWLHLATATIAAAVSLVVLDGVRGRVPFRRPRLGEMRLGLPYSIGFGADKLRESADVVLLLRLGSGVEAGIYGAATRLVNLAVLPVRALIASSNARIFAAGARSVGDAASVARRVTLLVVGYTVPAAVLVAVAGPAAVSVLSSEYAATGEALRLLAVLPLLIGLEAYVATALTAVGRQGLRVASTLASTGVNVALNIWWIPEYGWRGAAVATLLSSALNGTVCWSVLGWLTARGRTAPPSPLPSTVGGRS